MIYTFYLVNSKHILNVIFDGRIVLFVLFHSVDFVQFEIPITCLLGLSIYVD